MRFHVETVAPGNVVVNAQSFASQREARLAATEQTRELLNDNQSLQERYATHCRESLLDIDDPANDSIPMLLQYDYTYRVAPCSEELAACIACIEANYHAAA